jgi:hypothetical protein
MFVIETQVYEDYGTRIKPKGGRTIRCEVDTREEAESVASIIADEFEHILDIDERPNNWESKHVTWQREDRDGFTLYLDPVVRRSEKNGCYYLQRGHIVGDYADDEFDHLKGKFCGFVDNISTGVCVLQIEGDKRTRVDESYLEAA